MKNCIFLLSVIIIPFIFMLFKKTAFCRCSSAMQTVDFSRERTAQTKKSGEYDNIALQAMAEEA